jgi:hypothetical protein
LAVEYLQGDTAAFALLSQNLTIAARRLAHVAEKAHGGRPKNDFERFAASKLFDACAAIHGNGAFQSRSWKKKAAWRCVVEALMMIGVTQSAAEQAASDAQKLPTFKG